MSEHPYRRDSRELPSSTRRNEKPAVCNPSWVCTRIRSRWLPKPGLSTSRTTSNKFLLLFTSHSTHSVLLEQPDWTNTPPHCTDEETKDQKGYTAFPKSGGYQGVSKDSKPTMRTHSHTHSWVIPPLTNSSKNSCSRALRYSSGHRVYGRSFALILTVPFKD